MRWAAPVTAAAVVTLAVSLVLVEGGPNGGVVPLSPTASSGPVSSAGPADGPRYYAAISQQNGVAVGDSVTERRWRSSLLKAISDALPEGATFGFNGRVETSDTWIHVFGPGGGLGREVSREVLNTALVSLGSPGLES